MKRYFVFILLIFRLLTVSAQDNKPAEKKKEEDPIKKVEGAFDKAFDGLFKTKKKDEANTKPEVDKSKESNEVKKEQTGGRFSFGGKPKANYDFVSSMTMKVESKPVKEKTSTIMRSKYYFGADDLVMGVKFLSSTNEDLEKSQSTMDMFLMDFEQNKFFTFTNNDGTKNVMAIGFKPDKFEQYVTQEEDQIKITKTGETKTIVGYKCDGYKIEDKESKDQVLMWISQNRVGDFAKMGQKMGMNSGGMMGKSASKNYMSYSQHSELNKIISQGRAVLGYSIRSEKGDQTDMEVEEIKANDVLKFDTSTYKSLF
jgi:hypothetical protein